MLIDVQETVQGRAQRAVREIGSRLCQRDVLEEALEQSAETSRYPSGWSATSIASGPPGVSFLFREIGRALDDERSAWFARSDTILQEITANDDLDDTDDSLLSGSAGVLMAYLDACTDDPAHTARAWEIVTDLADSVLLREPLPDDGGVADSHYDVINGSAGTLVALSQAMRLLGESSMVRAAMDSLVGDLVELCRPRGADGGRGWWIAPRFYLTEQTTQAYPRGYVNLGLAHGLPGILVGLGAAISAGTAVPGAESTARGIVDVLRSHQMQDADGPNWPSGIPVEDGRPLSAPFVPHPARTAWCYGGPGIASALARAAEALGDRDVRTLAEETMQAALARALREGTLESATLCHGSAGVLLTGMDVLGQVPSAQAPLESLCTRLLDGLDPDVPLLVRDFEPPDRHLDSPGLLTGAAGVALALAAYTRPHASSTWQVALGTAAAGARSR